MKTIFLVFSEKVLADKPPIAIVEIKELGTGKKKQPLIVPSLLCFAYTEKRDLKLKNTIQL